MKRSLKQIAEAVGARLIGDGHAEVGAVASMESATQQDLVFVDDEKHLSAALQSRAGAIIAGEFAASATSARPLLISDHPKLAFARAARLLRDGSPRDNTAPHLYVHPTAVVHPSTVLAGDVLVEECAVVSEDVMVESNTRIGSGSTVGAGVRIGHDCEIYPNVTIYPGTRLGHRVIVHAGAVLGSDGFGYVRDRKTGHYEKFPQVGRLVIVDDVEIGANTTIDRGALDDTVIEDGVKLDNQIQIGHNVRIGAHTAMAGCVGIAGSARIGSHCTVGGAAMIMGHLEIANHVHISAGTLVTKSISVAGKYTGVFPLQPNRDWSRTAVLLRNIDKLEERIRMLERMVSDMTQKE
jgi:UDP-3-O-[3-hydroxymyristoyl] glucosamine N-acyltransferase